MTLWYVCRYNSKKIELHTGQKHQKVNHSKEYKTKEGIHTNVVEGNNYALKSKFVVFCFDFTTFFP